MKWTFVYLGVTVFTVTSFSPCIASSNQIVYGLEHAKQFNHQIQHNLYIQAASFADQSKAYQLQRALRSKTTYSINVSHHEQAYAVLIGPIHSAAELRKTATHLLSTSKQPFNKSKHETKHALKSRLKNGAHAIAVATQPHVLPSFIPFIPPHQEPVFSEKKTPENPSTTVIETSNNSADSRANWFVAAGVGEQFPLSSNNMLMNNNSGFPVPFDQDIYSTQNQSTTVIAASAGRRWERDAVWFPSYSASIAWQYFSNSNVGNTITQYSDPQFTNYNYRWNVKSNLVLASAKLNLIQYWKLSPFVNAGVGGSFNETSNYSETALSGVTPRLSPGFTNGSAAQFAYQAGAGLDMHLSPQVLFSVGYNYQNLGNVSSGPGTGTWSNRSLNLGSYASNEVLFSVNYLFGK